MTRRTASSQPCNVCFSCGKLYGCKVVLGRVITIHTGKCDVCGRTTEVSDPRDYGFLNRDWTKHGRDSD